MPLVYPRIGDALGLELLARLRETVAKKEPLEALIGFDHPAAAPVATGASVATRARLEDIRAQVIDSVAHLWTPGLEVAHARRSELDRRLGVRLHSVLDILPADAAHSGTWTFLTLVVFPDLAWARFPDLHESRMLGGPRNALRRTWARHHVLGDLHSEPRNPLGEDELVGLFERSALARNKRLVRVLAREVLASEATPRSDFARRLYKTVTHLTGPLLLDSLTDHQLGALVRAAASGEQWPAADEVSSAEGATTVSDPIPAPPRTTVGDLVLEFHREAVELSRRILAETSYRPTQLLVMLNEQGGVETARQVVGQSQPSTGFMALMDLGRLDLAFENLVLDATYRGLFSDDVVELAEERLATYRGYGE